MERWKHFPSATIFPSIHGIGRNRLNWLHFSRKGILQHPFGRQECQQQQRLIRLFSEPFYDILPAAGLAVFHMEFTDKEIWVSINSPGDILQIVSFFNRKKYLNKYFYSISHTFQKCWYFSQTPQFKKLSIRFENKLAQNSKLCT